MGGWYKNRSGHDWTGTVLDRTGFDKKEWVGGIQIGVEMIGQGQDWTGQNWKDVIGREDRCRIVHGTRLNRTVSERGMIGRDMMNRTGLDVDRLNGTGLDGNDWDSKKYG
jgi:hypothetical protein